MATGRIRRTARRGIAAAVLAWLGVAALAVLVAPTASAAPTATVEIRDLTPPVVSVDAGGTVTFVNRIADKSLPLVGTVHTDVTLGLPSGAKPLAPGASVSERFAGTCATCTISYRYRLASGASLTGAVLSQLPALPAAPTPFVVNTIAPAVPNLPSVNVPQVPTLPTLPTIPGVNPPPAPAPVPPPTVPGAPVDEQPPGEEAPPAGPTGEPYQYGTGVPQMSPTDAVAAAAFDPKRFYVPGQSLGTADRAGSGSGGMAGSYDGASVPVFGQLAGLDGSSLDEESAASASSTSPAAQALPAAALAAVVALAAVTAALVRTHQAQRSSR